MTAFGCGRAEVEDDAWASVTSTIELDIDVLEATATLGLDGFSDIEVVFVFDRVDPPSGVHRSRHPRGRTDWPEVGILAQRGKDRPDRIGLTVCGVVRVDGRTIEVAGLDAVDGTPVLDVEPFMADFAPRTSVREPAWATDLMDGSW